MEVSSGTDIECGCIRLAFPFLHEDGVKLVLHTVYLITLPSGKREHVVIERRAPVGPDIEAPAMRLNRIHYLLRTRAAVHARPGYAYDGHSRTVSNELLVGRLGVVFLRPDEPVVKIKIVLSAALQLSRGKQGLDQQALTLSAVLNS